MSAKIDDPTQTILEEPQSQSTEGATESAPPAPTQAAGALQNPSGEIPLRDSAAKFLIRILEGGGTEALTFPLPVKQLLWNGQDFSRVARWLSIDGPWLQVLCGGDGYTRVHPDLAMLSSRDLQNKPLKGKLEGGYQFSAKFALGNRFNAIHAEGEPPHCSILIAGMQWVLKREEPEFWLGTLEGMTDVPLPGNLVAYARIDNSLIATATNYRLQGKYIYYLLQTKNRWLLIIDNQDRTELDVQGFSEDFLALEFILGRQLNLQHLDGFTAQGELVARTGGGYGHEKPLPRSERPVPILRNHEILFFEAISRAFREQPDVRLSIALMSYLDALTSHVDIAYMRLQIALEAFSFWVLRCKSDANEQLVEDKKAWEKWVRSHKEEIYKFARKGVDAPGTAKLATDFYIKVKTAGNHASSVRTAEAFALFGLVTTEEMDEEISLRNPVVHTMMMEDGEYDIQQASKRIGMIRALLVALVAKVVGYQGDIEGSNYLEGGRWWKAGSARVSFYRAGEPPDWFEQ